MAEPWQAPARITFPSAAFPLSSQGFVPPSLQGSRSGPLSRHPRARLELPLRVGCRMSANPGTAPAATSPGWAQLPGWETWTYGSPCPCHCEPWARRAAGPAWPRLRLFSALSVPGGKRALRSVKGESCFGDCWRRHQCSMQARLYSD